MSIFYGVEVKGWWGLAWVNGMRSARGRGLTPIEYRLSAELVLHAGKLLTHRHLLSSVWGAAYAGSTHTLRVHMAAIRAKIDADPAHPRFIRTETGVGYRLLVG